MRPRSLLFVVLPLLTSCGFAVEGAPLEPAPADEPAAIETPSDARGAMESAPAEPAEAVEDGHVIPRGPFPTIEALCAKQREDIAPRVAEAAASLRERGLEIDLEPSCEEAPRALEQATISLRAPFLEARALTVEIGGGVGTYLAVRTEGGWLGIDEPLEVDYADDPGCPSIERDGGLLELRVLGSSVPTLVMLSAAGRGWYEDDRYGELALEKARACTIERGGITCGAPEVVRAELATYADGDAPQASKEIFKTHFAVDEHGALDVDERFVAP